MGYTTYFTGQIKIEPPLSAREVEYLQQYNDKRHFRRQDHNEYWLGGSDAWPQPDGEAGDYSNPPAGVPGLYCGWTVLGDGTAIEHDGGEKFYDAEHWMLYLIRHFIGDDPRAPKADSNLAFFTGHVLNGLIYAEGEESPDHWKIEVENNQVFTRRSRLIWETGRDEVTETRGDRY